jgi:hypothetical protein
LPHCKANVSVGSKPEKLNVSICFPLFTQQRTFVGAKYSF